MEEVPESLVRYEDPISLSDTSIGRSLSNNLEEKSRDTRLKGAKTTSGNTQKDDLVDNMLPPREWTTRSGNSYMQYVSKEGASRSDAIHLQEALEARMAERQGRLDGICPVRDDLYKQCFDEIIRQVALDQPERGQLLLRVRDEARMTVEAYKTLYDSSMVFGIRKAIQTEEGLSELEEELKRLEDENKEKQQQAVELQNAIATQTKRESELQALNEKKRKEEIAFLKYQGQNLEKFLKSISA